MVYSCTELINDRIEVRGDEDLMIFNDLDDTRGSGQVSKGSRPKLGDDSAQLGDDARNAEQRTHVTTTPAHPASPRDSHADS